MDYDPALAAWLGLEEETRREVRRLARRLRPHPDAQVAAIAAAYSSTQLNRAPRRRVEARLTVGLAGACLAGVVTLLAATADRRLTQPEIILILIVVLAADLVLLRDLRRRAQRRNLVLTEAANRLAASAPPQVPPASPPGQAPAGGRESAVVCCSAAKLCSYAIRSAGIALCMLLVGALAIAAMPSNTGAALQAPLTVMTVVCSLAAFYQVVQLTVLAETFVYWALRRRPIIYMHPAGVRFGALGYTLPWTELAEIRTFPLRARRSWRQGTPRQVIAFVPRQPAEVCASLRLSRRRRSNAGRALRIYGTCLTVTDIFTDHTGEQIATLAGQFSPLSIRRYN